jgi:spore coat protein U-like protein
MSRHRLRSSTTSLRAPLDAAVWGDGADTSSVVVSDTGDGMSVPNTLTVYGRLLASDNTGAIADGIYTDNITATVTY